MVTMTVSTDGKNQRQPAVIVHHFRKTAITETKPGTGEQARYRPRKTGAEMFIQLLRHCGGGPGRKTGAPAGIVLVQHSQ